MVVYFEDDALSREIMQILLTRVLNYPKLVIFEDSNDFIAKLENLPEPPTLVLLDIHIQPSNGFEMATALRQHPHLNNLPIIAISASIPHKVIKNLQQVGFNGGIAKPIDYHTFPTLFHQILNGQEVWEID